MAQLKPSVQETHHDKHEFISMTADKPYGLDVDSFLPVRVSVLLYELVVRLYRFSGKREVQITGLAAPHHIAEQAIIREITG